MDGITMFQNVEVLTDGNCKKLLPYEEDFQNEDYFKELQTCASVLKRKYKGAVTGLWYIAVPSVDGGTQFVIRMREQLPAIKRNELSADVFDFTGHEMAYQITHESVRGVRSIPIADWVKEGRVYAVFDSERGV